MKVNRIWDEYPDIKRDLGSVINLMEKNIKCKDKKIEGSIKELIFSGGKMLRPGLSLIASRFGNYDEKRSVAVAASLELLHMATLVHDDVIDDSKTRRGLETLQSKYGKDYAVYIGDYLFCVVFKLLSTHSTSLASIQMDSRAMEKICLGEIDQMNSRFNLEMTTKGYLKRISGKTAELFALSLLSGAKESGVSDKICKIFYEIGHNVGMAFQIMDDILDYTSDEDIMGKPVCSDIIQGLYNLPLIYAINEDKDTFKKLLTKDLTQEDVKIIIDLVIKTGGVEKSIDIAKKYINKSHKLIDKLPQNPNKEVLKGLINRIIS